MSGLSQNKLIMGLIIMAVSFLYCYESPERDNPYDPENWDILYPETGYYGPNILSPVPRTISLDTDYSMRVLIDGYSTIRISVPKEIDIWPQYTDWRILSSDNWEYKSFITDRGPGLYDCGIKFIGPQGPYEDEIKIYENDANTPTRVIVVSWQ